MLEVRCLMISQVKPGNKPVSLVQAHGNFCLLFLGNHDCESKDSGNREVFFNSGRQTASLIPLSVSRSFVLERICGGSRRFQKCCEGARGGGVVKSHGESGFVGLAGGFDGGFEGSCHAHGILGGGDGCVHKHGVGTHF